MRCKRNFWTFLRVAGARAPTACSALLDDDDAQNASSVNEFEFERIMILLSRILYSECTRTGTTIHSDNDNDNVFLKMNTTIINAERKGHPRNPNTT